jgi:MFS family permease
MAEPPGSSAQHDGMPPGLPRLLAVATITIGLMMSVLSNSMTNLALPYIAKDLAITAESSIWIVNAYQIALMVSLLPVAAFADIVGYRHVYRFGLAAFCIASLGCVLAPSLPWLIVARFVQGVSGSAIMSVQPALVRAIYPRNMLGRGLGFNTTVVATSLAAGPSLGAALLQLWSWPILFAVYIPLGIISFALAERYLPRTSHTHRPFDVLSAVFSGVTFGLLIFGIDGIAHGHAPIVIVAELGGSLVMGTFFVLSPVDHGLDLYLHGTGPRLRQPALLLSYGARPRRHQHRHPADGLAAGAGDHRTNRRTSGRPPPRRRAGRDRTHQHDGRAGPDGPAATGSFGCQHHVATGAVWRGLRHFRFTQQPADDERRAA